MTEETEEHPLHAHNPARIADLMETMSLPEEALQDPKTEKWLADQLTEQRAQNAQSPEDDRIPQTHMADWLRQWAAEERQSALAPLSRELGKPSPSFFRLAELYQAAPQGLDPSRKVLWHKLGAMIQQHRFTQASLLVRRLCKSTDEGQ